MKVYVKLDRSAYNKNKFIYFANQAGDLTQNYTFRQAQEHVRFCQAMGIEVVNNEYIDFTKDGIY